MDSTYRRKTAGGGRPVHRTKRPVRQNGGQGDRRRLVRLLVSLALFLMVYIGRGVFPAWFEMWRNAIYRNVDFSAAFQEFGRAVSEGRPMRESLEALGVRILGGELEPDVPDSAEKEPVNVILLSQTPGAGRAWLSSHGIMAGTGEENMVDEPPVPSASQQPEETNTPTPDPTQPVLETAVPQEYSEDGVKLPSNVSFAFYELGLPETVDPVTGPVTSVFGYRDSPINGEYEFHLALDIGAAEGTEIGAFADGTVEYIGESDEFGQYLKITHANGVSSFYAHCSKLLVKKGETVTCGQTVALVGHTGNATGPHLHLTIEKDNVRLDPAYYVGLS